jgi:hypothetical protein
MLWDGSGRNDDSEPYVATPRGGTRPLNDDEATVVMLEKYKRTLKKKSTVYE